MVDEDELGQSENQQSKRLKSALFGNRPPKKDPVHSSSPIGQLFSIKKERKTAEFRTPSKSSFGIGNLITTKSPEHINEGIEASDSDDDFESGFQTRNPLNEGQSVSTIENLPDIKERQMQPHNEGSLGEGEDALRQASKQEQVQSSSKKSSHAITPLTGNNVERNMGTNWIGKQGTPISAQRNFLSSHLKPSMLNTIPSSARRLDTKKGLGALESQLQQALKQRQSSSSNFVGSQFIVKEARQSEDLWITSCTLVQETMSASLQQHEQACVILRQQAGLEVYPEMRIRSAAPICKFTDNEGLYICLSDFDVLQ